MIFFEARADVRAVQAQQSRALAGYLQQDCGVQQGDRVLLVMQNSPQFIVAYYAILRANAIVVPVNPMSVTAELEHYVQDSGAKVALVAQEVYPQMQPLLGTKRRARRSSPRTATTSTRRRTLRMPEVVSAPRQAISETGVTLWSDALAANRKPGALTHGTGRSVRHSVQLGHDRSSEGLHAHASQRDAHAGREHRAGSTASRTAASS